MIKKECLAMPELALSKETLAAIAAEKPEIRKDYYGRKSEVYKHRAYMVAAVNGDLLKASIFETHLIKRGAVEMPSYDIYINKAKMDYITYEPVEGKWLTA